MPLGDSSLLESNIFRRIDGVIRDYIDSDHEAHHLIA